MKPLYSRLIAGVVLLVFASPALADPGTTWWKRLQPNRRFKLVFSGDAVLDNETGRVWQRSPSRFSEIWASAVAYCYDLEVGGRKGWRLPTIEELASLVDTSNFPALPANHPFIFPDDEGEGLHPSATTDVRDSGRAWFLRLNFGTVFNDDKDRQPRGLPWCVRGGQGIDGVQ